MPGLEALTTDEPHERGNGTMVKAPNPEPTGPSDRIDDFGREQVSWYEI
jgi:hypothetical protein